jgi:tetratricopeptide (TPR) repeat protein
VEEYHKSKEYLIKANLILNKINPSWLSACEMLLACLKYLEDNKNTDSIDFSKNYDQIKLKEAKSFVTRNIAKILLNVDDQHLSEAEGWIIKAIEVDKANGMMFYLGKNYALYAELFKRKGNESKAKENLDKAIEIFKECGADGWQEKAEQELASLS